MGYTGLVRERRKTVRLWLGALVAAGIMLGCHKPVPQARPGDPYGAQRLRTLTHDEDLVTPARSADPAGWLRAIATASSAPSRPLQGP
jgi:hypothetical protein